MTRQFEDSNHHCACMTRSTRECVFTLIAAALVLVACDKVSGILAAPAVAATVNGVAVTVAQVDLAMSREPILGVSDHPWPTTAAALDELIDQELILQKAREAQIDRDPEVMQATQSARRAELASAWLRSAVGVVPAPNDQQIDDYLHHHPELASGRRFFNWRLASLQASAAQIADIQQQVASNVNFDEILGYLDANNVRYVKDQRAAASDQISAESLKQLSAINPGDITLFTNGGHFELVQLTSEYAAPIDEGPVRKLVEATLSQQRTKDAVDAKIASLRASANIEFMGDFKALAPVRPSAAISQTEGKETDQGIGKGLQ
jgi:EpsD family peptidyl-prolyl cis-trans isomerase